MISVDGNTTEITYEVTLTDDPDKIIWTTEEPGGETFLWQRGDVEILAIHKCKTGMKGTVRFENANLFYFKRPNSSPFQKKRVDPHPINRINGNQRYNEMKRYSLAV